MERTIKEASVEGVRIKRKPTKHVVYAVKTTWSDGQVNVVSRRYSEFFTLMKKLTDKFDESGRKSKDKIIPTLQGKRINFLGNNVMKRLENVTSFTKKLFVLSANISQSQIVHDFFRPTFADLESSRRSTKRGKKKTQANTLLKKKLAKEISITGPISFEEYYAVDDLKKTCKNGLDLKKGQVVEIIEKHQTGWWFVSSEGDQGWVPKSYLTQEHEDCTAIKFEPGFGEIYVSTKKYKAEQPDELSFDVGVHLQIIEKHSDGWWKAIYCGCEGMVPSTFLKLVGQSNQQDKPSKNNTSGISANQDSDQSKKTKVYRISRYSKHKQSRSNMDFDTMKKLRSSTFTSPEENDSVERTKKKSTPSCPKVHVPSKNSCGWVPQDITISRSRTFGHSDKKKPAKVEKHSSFSGKIFKTNPKQSDSTQMDMEDESDPLPASRSRRLKSAPQIAIMQDKAFLDGLATKHRQSLPKISLNDGGVKRSNSTLLVPSRTRGKRMAPAPPQGGYDIKNNLLAPPGVSTKARSLPRQNLVSSQKNNKKASLDKTIKEKALHRSSSCPDLVSEKEAETTRKSNSLPMSCVQFDAENGLDESNDSDDEDTGSSMEDIIVTYKDMRESESSGKDVRKDSGFEEDQAVYVAKANFTGSQDNGEINLLENQQVWVLEKNASGWWLVEANGKSGWAPSNYLTKFQQELESEDEEDELITHQELEDSTAFSCIPDSYCSEDSGVASKQSVQSAEESGNHVAVASYNGVKEDGEVDLIKDQKVRVLQKTGELGWWLVESNGETGWAPSNYLEEASTKDEIVGDYRAECREVPDLSQLQISKGSRFEVLDAHDNGQFVLVRIPAKVGWLPVSSFDQESLLPHCTSNPQQDY